MKKQFLILQVWSGICEPAFLSESSGDVGFAGTRTVFGAARLKFEVTDDFQGDNYNCHEETKQNQVILPVAVPKRNKYVDFYNSDT